MGRPRQISDEQIDDAARATFLEHGHAAPVALVAAKLGVSHVALLRRAGSKDALLMRALAPRPTGAPMSSPHVASSPRAGLGAIVAQLRGGPPDRARAKCLVSMLVDLHDVLKQMLPGLVVLRARGLPTGPPPGIEAPTLMLRRRLAEWLVRAGLRPDARVAAVAEALLGAMEAHCFNAYVGGPSFVSEEPRALVERLVAGLLPELGSSSRSAHSARRRRSADSLVRNPNPKESRK